jgi:hypothetical protein
MSRYIYWGLELLLKFITTQHDMGREREISFIRYLGSKTLTAFASYHTGDICVVPRSS